VIQALCVFVMSPWWDERMDTIMKRRRHTPEQAVRKIREGERLLNEGQELAEVLRHLEVTEATFNRWRAQYGGMKADEAKRLKSLEVENQRLKKLVAEQALDIDMLKELAEGRMKVKPSRSSSWRVVAVGVASP
jgi:putative transposase